MLRKIYKFALILSILLCGLPTIAQRTLTRETDGQKRLALIIGNGNYENARKLGNPPNDATDMTATLTELGFEVISGTNLNLKQMTEKVREFGDKLRASGGVGLFYYAGHGVQVNGRNYLIPVEADIPREDEIGFVALDLNQVLQKMATANNGLNIVVLDACRNNPFARGWSRDASDDGLAQITAPKGTFIAYATSPDMTASDGTGRNGLYTAELLKYIKQPNLKIEETFKEVTKAVDGKSGGRQTPWFSSSLRGEFIFKPNIKTVAVTKPILTEKTNTADSPVFFEPPTSAVKEASTIRTKETLSTEESLKKFIERVSLRKFIDGMKGIDNTVIANGNLTEIKGKRKVYVTVSFHDLSDQPLMLGVSSGSPPNKKEQESVIAIKEREERERRNANDEREKIIGRLKKYAGVEVVETSATSDFIIYYTTTLSHQIWEVPEYLRTKGGATVSENDVKKGDMFVVVNGNNTPNYSAPDDSKQFRVLWNYSASQTKSRSTEKMTAFLIEELKKAWGEK